MKSDVSVVEQVDEELLQAVNHLLPQWLSDEPLLDRAAIERQLSH